MDDSGDIPIAMSLQGWILLSLIVNPFILNILFVYYHSIHLQVVIPWSPQAVLRFGPRVLMFYTLFTPRCIYCRLVQVGMFMLYGVFIQYDTRAMSVLQ